MADTGFVVLCDRVLPGEKFIGRVTRKKGSYAEVSRFIAFIARPLLFFCSLNFDYCISFCFVCGEICLTLRFI